MHKNVLINVVGVLILLAAIAGGIYLYEKNQLAPAPEPSLPQSAVAVNSTGGTLQVTETPIGQTPADTAASASVAASENSSQPITNQTSNKTMNHVTIDTNFGKIVLELYSKDAPKAAENFVTLAQKGFYNNLIFHRVISGFMIQGGDPTGTGTGGPGYQFADELDPTTSSYQAGYKKGVLAMANAGPNTNGSQFFIMLADYPLPHNYTIFGHVISGQNVVDQIGAVKTGANDRPVTPVVMKSVSVSE